MTDKVEANVAAFAFLSSQLIHFFLQSSSFSARTFIVIPLSSFFFFFSFPRDIATRNRKIFSIPHSRPMFFLAQFFALV